MSGRWRLLLAVLAIATLANAKPWDRSEEETEDEGGTFSRMYRRYIDPSNPDSVLGRVGKFFSGVYNFFKRRFGYGDDEPPQRERFPEPDPSFPSRRFEPATRLAPPIPSRTTTSTTTTRGTTTTTTTTQAPSSQRASEIPVTQEPSSYAPEDTTMRDVPDYYSSDRPQESDTPGVISTENIPQSSTINPTIDPSEAATQEREIELGTSGPEVVIDEGRPIIHSLEDEDDYNNAIPDDSTFYTRVRDKK